MSAKQKGSKTAAAAAAANADGKAAAAPGGDTAAATPPPEAGYDPTGNTGGRPAGDDTASAASDTAADAGSAANPSDPPERPATPTAPPEAVAARAALASGSGNRTRPLPSGTAQQLAAALAEQTADESALDIPEPPAPALAAAAAAKSAPKKAGSGKDGKSDSKADQTKAGNPPKPAAAAAAAASANGEKKDDDPAAQDEKKDDKKGKKVVVHNSFTLIGVDFKNLAVDWYLNALADTGVPVGFEHVELQRLDQKYSADVHIVAAAVAEAFAKGDDALRQKLAVIGPQAVASSATAVTAAELASVSPADSAKYMAQLCELCAQSHEATGLYLHLLIAAKALGDVCASSVTLARAVEDLKEPFGLKTFAARMVKACARVLRAAVIAGGDRTKVVSILKELTNMPVEQLSTIVECAATGKADGVWAVMSGAHDAGVLSEFVAAVPSVEAIKEARARKEKAAAAAAAPNPNAAKKAKPKAKAERKGPDDKEKKERTPGRTTRSGEKRKAPGVVEVDSDPNPENEDNDAAEDVAADPDYDDGKKHFKTKSTAKGSTATGGAPKGETPTKKLKFDISEDDGAPPAPKLKELPVKDDVMYELSPFKALRDLRNQYPALVHELRPPVTPTGEVVNGAEQLPSGAVLVYRTAVKENDITSVQQQVRALKSNATVKGVAVQEELAQPHATCQIAVEKGPQLLSRVLGNGPLCSRIFGCQAVADGGQLADVPALVRDAAFAPGPNHEHWQKFAAANDATVVMRVHDFLPDSAGRCSGFNYDAPHCEPNHLAVVHALLRAPKLQPEDKEIIPVVHYVLKHPAANIAEFTDVYKAPLRSLGMWLHQGYSVHFFRQQPGDVVMFGPATIHGTVLVPGHTLVTRWYLPTTGLVNVLAAKPLVYPSIRAGQLEGWAQPKELADFTLALRGGRHRHGWWPAGLADPVGLIEAVANAVIAKRKLMLPVTWERICFVVTSAVTLVVSGVTRYGTVDTDVGQSVVRRLLKTEKALRASAAAAAEAATAPAGASAAAAATPGLSALCVDF